MEDTRFCTEWAQAFPDFYLLFISSWIEFSFVKVVPKYLKSSTLRRTVTQILEYLYLFTVFLNEERNELGDQVFQVVLDYVKKNKELGIEIGEVITAVGNTTDVKSFLESGKCNSISTK